MQRKLDCGCAYEQLHEYTFKITAFCADATEFIRAQTSVQPTLDHSWAAAVVGTQLGQHLFLGSKTAIVFDFRKITKEIS